ncbi:hypothetical protein EVAR_48293_1 [Eumeta japonica]|uniref:Uncharacterized protein n=1 Tax=Eumeta variegata TaxID=151549 RepID=A0A4C1WLF4_EUMVA|nr:hypothetical protein EVAR_48293_1 [Eumeta japonica]
MAPRKSQEVLSSTLQNLHDDTNVMVEWLRERIILATKNDIVNGINNIIQEMAPKEEEIYMSTETMTDEQESINLPTEF